jgi:hypothetical protein
MVDCAIVSLCKAMRNETPEKGKKSPAKGRLDASECLRTNRMRSIRLPWEWEVWCMCSPEMHRKGIVTGIEREGWVRRR